MLSLRLFIVLFLSTLSLSAQSPVQIHSHNDYSQLLPFWKAYRSGLNSIEVDLFYKNGILYATHDEKDIVPNHTFESLYLKPLSKVISTHLGNEQAIQLLIDLKSEAYSTLAAIENILKKYPELINHPKLTFVISGYRPLIKDYKNYPDYLLFDYQSLDPIPTESSHKVALISLSFHKFSSWDGVKNLPENDYKNIKSVIAQAHALNKPFRFWGAPDTPLAWKTFHELGLDFINTDHPLECSNFFKTTTKSTDEIKIGFVSDIHFQDIYGTFSDTNYKGIFNNQTNKFTLLRTMDAQLHSTRIFNENYFALFAVLDDMVSKSIKYVALPGDYTDDGQPIHLRGLQQILERYETTHGMQFFITTGNHDPVGPFDLDSGKSDFMGSNGAPQGIYSMINKKHHEHDKLPDILSKDIKKSGYQGIFNYMKSFGFFPEEQYLYWATPFSKYSPETYTYQKALENATITKRMYDMMSGDLIPDASYVVEPVPNVWLLALDGNVYLPRDTTNSKASHPKNYEGSSLGYNHVLKYKMHLMNWVKTISEEAKRLKKTLITFSHYPMIDFNDDASQQLKTFFGGNKWQLERVPDEKVAQQFSEAGITIHVAGHMHINDTGTRTYSHGKSLVNIQTPSIAAYIPGYKILTIKPNNMIEVNTITIDSVPHFNDLFPLYEKEYHYLKQHHLKVWNRDILKTQSYHEFTIFHLKELVRLRFLEDDWIPSFKDFMLQVSGEELLLVPYLDSEIDIKTLLHHKSLYKKNWEEAQIKAELALKDTDFTLKDFKHWNGFDMIFDFYRIRNADVLAIQDIGAQQIDLYKWLFKHYKIKHKSTDLNRQKLLDFYSIFYQFLNGAPSNNFQIDYHTGVITALD